MGVMISLLVLERIPLSSLQDVGDYQNRGTKAKTKRKVEFFFKKAQNPYILK